MGPVKDISARFADREELQTLLEQGYCCAPTELGGLWYHPDQITLGDQVIIRLLGTLWSYTIFVRGARAI